MRKIKTIDKRVADNLRSLRKRKKIKDWQMANLLDIHHMDYLRYEKKMLRLPVSLLPDIAEILEVEIDDLYLTHSLQKNVVKIQACK